MRDPRINAAALGVCGRLAREVAGLLNLEVRMSDAVADTKLRARRRSLHIEPLESRHLMDAGGAASLISAVWFQDVSDHADVAHAGVADWTVESDVASGQAALTAGQSDLYDWIVQFDTAAVAGVASVAETASLLVGGGIEFEVLRGLGLVGQVLVRSSDASIEAVQSLLSGNVNVAGFEQDAIRQVDVTVPTDPYYNQLWGMTAIDAPDAWTITTGSSSVVVAVIDTGVDYTHVDLAANIWTNPGEIAGNGIDDDRNGFVDDVYGYDFVNNDGDPMDDNSHGTHVSGTIAAVANNGVGVAGVNWSSSIMALKFLDGNGSGYLSDAVRAINYATMMRNQYGVNVRVMNNSWGGGGYSYALYSAIEAGNNADILFVAAAGNSGSNNDVSPQYPANYSCSNVVSVAAVASSGQLASFSSYGATTVDLAAPGVSIYSTVPGNRYASYSGTSMAAPHVAGVAALAFALAPDASVAEVRDAILGGAEPLAALSGKTAAGGTLNAYNTLQLLDAQPPQGPVIGSLSVSPNSATLGASVALVAGGLADATGTITGVYVSWDVNNNGQYDAEDPTVGGTTTIVGNEATITLDTNRFGEGTHRLFAAALDSNSHWSALATTFFTVIAPDDHGDSAASATAVGVPSSTAAALGVAGDADWFKFQAVAGKTYTFTTQLDTLSDSVLYLFDRDGARRLAYNDDVRYGDLSSRIGWTAPSSGTYYLAVAGYGNYYSGTYSLNVQIDNSAPVLAAIGDRTMSHNETTLTVPISASDADGDRLSYSAQALSVDPLARQAYELDREFGLYQWEGSFWTNLRGENEKYFAGYYNGARNPYFILPDGDLYRWGGSIAASTYVATLNAEYYSNPFLLCEAQPPEYTPIDGGDVQLSISGGELTIARAADFADDFIVQVNVSDGVATDSEAFSVSVTNFAPELASIGDRTMSYYQTTLVISVNATDADGDRLSYSAQALAIDPLAQQAYELDQEFGLYQWQGSFWTNLRGENEKYFAGYHNGTRNPYFILPNGDLYRWGGSIAASTYVATFSVDYYANPFLLCEAPPPTLTSFRSGAVSVSMAGDVLTISRDSGYTGEFFVQVHVSDGVNTSGETFRVSATGAASLQSVALAIELPSLALGTMSMAGDAPSDLPDLRSAWLTHFADDRFGRGDDVVQAANLLASRISDSTALLHDDVFARLSPPEGSPTGMEGAAWDELVGQMLAGRRYENRLFSDRLATDRDAASEDDASDYGFGQWGLLERSAIDLLHDSLSEQLTSPAISV
ncbi:MAG: S8 family serine peptidase [Planctomycetes bacterium]|nr:S8 family serine peptidase [Planctomycetota bacterium]